MNWIKYLIIILSFYILVLLQSGFFAHFSFFGAIPNLVFVLFFLFIFFEDIKNPYGVAFLGITAGFFLDIFSYAYFGQSIILLLIVGFGLKNLQALLKSQQNRYPFAYFAPLFCVSFIVYEVLLMLFLRFVDPLHAKIIFNWAFLAEIAYNLAFASAAFYIYKFLSEKLIDTRQLKLFR